jgi:hypothetical protein
LKPSKLPLKPLDFFVIAAASALTAFSAFAAYARPQARAQAVIRSSGRTSAGGASLAVGSGQTWVYPLDAAETLSIPGPLGDTVVEIREGRVRFVSSPCLNQTCVASGHISAQGQWAACLPNKVFVSIEGTDGVEGSVDSTAW